MQYKRRNNISGKWSTNRNRPIKKGEYTRLFRFDTV